MKRIVYILVAVVVYWYVSMSSLLLVHLPGVSSQPALEEAPPSITEEQVLNLYGIDPLTLDPAVSGEMTSHEYVMQLFGGLVSLDDSLKPTPDIAQSWQVSDNGRTYTFYLRQDVMFHNGRQVKAEDFKYSWERACNPDTGSQTAATYLGDIVGGKEVLSGESEEISGVRVVDDYTLRVTIDAPKSYFLSKLTYPTAFVVDRADVESGGEWWRNPNGTGPFKLKQWDESSLLVLEKNELYYGEVAKVNLVVFQLWGGVPMNMYETGKIDITSVYRDYIEKATDEAGPFYTDLRITPELSFFYIGFNTTKPPFDDVNIRRAFSQAIDKDKLVSLVFKGMMQQADGILPPGMPGYNEGLLGLDYDIDGARELIANSSYGDVSQLPPIAITTIGWGGLISQELEAIIQEWRSNLGVEVEVRQLEPQRFLYHLKQEKDEMFYMGWIADYPHPQDFLDVLFHTGADNNYSEYSNPEVDALLERTGVEQDNNLSLALYQQAE
ncbi:MAG: peptide ABC transporter substrate-binding protein, partial [Dehalococcoidia bacterium]|nr:peptide ABC transporter substrate-binding protein [Dehalococcoidia bacterium]